jgi:hypothetical protein
VTRRNDFAGDSFLSNLVLRSSVGYGGGHAAPRRPASAIKAAGRISGAIRGLEMSDSTDSNQRRLPVLRDRCSEFDGSCTAISPPQSAFAHDLGGWQSPNTASQSALHRRSSP